jgi:hypothetical protein
MARSDDNSVEVGCNEERRLCGLAGDDEEEDMREDADELFGIRADDPIVVGDGDDGGAGNQAEAEGSDDDEEGRGSRPSTSVVWQDFKKLFKKVPGKRKPVRYAAKCIHCSKQYSALSSGGTGHLIRHRDKCPRRREKNRMSQSQISFNPDGTMRNWEYCPMRARSELVRFLARLDVPISMGESDAFEDYIRTAHNPAFVTVSRQTTTRDMVKFFIDRKAKLVELLSSSAVNCVCLTSDIWSGNAKEDYISVVAHYINYDWQLEKRVLGLVLIDVSHNGQNIADRVLSVLTDYGLSEKVFAVTLDNASSNASAMVRLRPILSKYLGIEVVNETQPNNGANSLFLHQRCACHIINLIVKEALEYLKPLIETFRTAISFLNSSNQRIAAYKSYCIATGVRPRKFQLDMEVRWNSTYLMLKSLFPHKIPFTTFMHAHYPRAEGEPFLLTDEHWVAAEKVFKFLELFYDATVALSGVYYPTSPLMIHYLVKIAIHLKNYANDMHIRAVVQPMIDKYNKYWRDIPLLYSFAFILDPRAKMKGFNRVLRRLGTLTGTDYDTYQLSTRARLTDVYNRYENKYGSVRLRRPVPPTLSGKKRSAWDEIYDDDDGDVPAGGMHSFSATLGMARDTSATALLQAASSSASTTSELISYLDCDTVSQLNDDFNILHWWHEHKLTYPVLSIMAKDILTVPVSTISSESTFSMTGRIIEERRRRLKPEMVETLTCIKDWEAAEARLQHMVEDKELEEAFEDLYLD